MKSNIKTLMRRDPGSTEIDNPLFADRVSRKPSASNYKVPQDAALEEKHQKQMNDVPRDRPSTSNEDYGSRRDRLVKTKSDALNRDSSNEQYKSKDRLPRDASNEDFSASSSKMQLRHKRQWKAPETKVEEKPIVKPTPPQPAAFGGQSAANNLAVNNKFDDF